jgi:GMP synthase-like glutamine amidotransferase
MIVYVQFEHERLKNNSALWRYFATKTLETKYRLEEIAEDDCIIVRYDRLSQKRLDQLKPRAVVVGGNYTGFQHFTQEELTGMRELFLHPKQPTLTICGSFQLMAETYGAEFGLIGNHNSEDKDADLDTDTPIPPELHDDAIERGAQGIKQEIGFTSLRILEKDHPLFKGMGRSPVFFELHGGEIKSSVDGFQRLAESEQCKVQALAHTEKPILGTQFHPELYNEDHPDGKRFLHNFFKLAEQAD